MKYKTSTLLIVASVFTIITTGNAQDFTDRLSQKDGKGVNLAMMGGGGMMGSRGIQDRLGSLGRDKPERPERWNSPEKNNRGYDYGNSNFAEDIEALRKQINAKRKELAALYRADKTDKADIDKKIDELSILERELDEKISIYNAGR